MNSMYLEATNSSPEVVMDYDKGLIKIEGQSYPENTFEFYEPVLKWLRSYCQQESDKSTTVLIKLTYFNSATSQVLFDFFDLIVEGELENIRVDWYYDGSKKSSFKDYEDYAEEFEELNFNAIEL